MTDATVGAAAWPMAARAQQAAMPIIGVLSPGLAAEASTGLRLRCAKALAKWALSKAATWRIEYHYAEYRYDRLPPLAAELVRRQVTVMVTNSTAVSAAKAATTTIPIVFVVVGNSVQQGVVASFNRPGGSITGISFLNNELMG